MAVNRTEIAAPPARVYEVLADPRTYEDWVVGASDIRDFEGEWPAPGATFHHTQFVPKVGIKDTTSVISSTPGRYLLMEVRGRPLMVADVELELEPSATGTRVTMTETPKRGILGRLHNPLNDRLLWLRNVESLRRLKRLAESGAGRRDYSTPA